MSDRSLDEYEAEMLTYAIEVLERAVAARRMLARASSSGRAVWRWSSEDPFDVIEAATAFVEFGRGWSR